MRIKWTSIPNVMGGNSTAPWVGPGLAERLKKEAATKERETEKKEKKKTSERAMEWLRRNR
jgi:hypothetical protein